MVNRPMVDILGPLHTSRNITFYLDASAAEDLRFGCILNNPWIWGKWQTGFIKNCTLSIEFLELFGLCARMLTWGKEKPPQNARIPIFCNNIAVVHMINPMSSSCKNCMYLLRLLSLDCLKNNRRVSARYVNTKYNYLADLLSRGKLEKFKKLGPHMTKYPDKINSWIWPITEVWQN